MRSPVQPLRRNSALYRVYDDLILWLKFENNFEDSSFYLQQTSGLNPSVVVPGYVDYYEGSHHLPNHYENRVDLPSFDSSRYKSAPYSAYFGSGQRFIQTGSIACAAAPCPQPGHYLSGCSVMVSGTGVYTTSPDFDSASEFDLEDDFTIEFYAQFSGVPDSPEPSTLFDFGNLKLTNTSGFFSVETPDGGTLDYYDHDFAYPAEGSSDWAPSMVNTWTHYAVQRRDDKITFWMGSRNQQGVDNNPFMVMAEDVRGGGLISGNKDDPYRNCRTVGSTISGTNFFSGWMDEFKVWKRAIYGPEPIINGGPNAQGIFVAPNWRDDFSTPAKRAAILSKKYSDPMCEIHSIQASSDPMLWCKIQTVYDPRFSVHHPLPYEVEWYKDSVSLNSRLGTSKNGIFGSDPNYSLSKYSTSLLGMGELIIKNFSPEDEGWYYAVIKMGPPNRPKYIWSAPRIRRQYLKYHWAPPPCPFGGVWPNCFCFGEDTKVLMHDKAEKRIADLIPGDRVFSFNKNEKITKSIVTNIEHNKVDSYYELVVNNKTLEVTDSHPIYVGNGEYKVPLDLKVNDLISIFENEKLIQAPITSRKEIKKRIDVYNLSVDSDKTFFVNGVAVHNKSPIVYPTLRMNGCSYYRTLGSDATLYNSWVGNRNLLGHPLTFLWTNAGRGVVADLPSGFSDQQSLTIKNIRKSIKGPICLSVTDVNGKTYGPVCCDIKLNLPNLQCPLIDSVDPNKSNKDITISSPFKMYTSSYTHICRGSTSIGIVPDEPRFSINFTVNAADPNASELATGGLKYEWWMTGVAWGTWQAGSPTFSMYFEDNSSTQIACRISYNNYPPGVYTIDPEGKNQYGRYSIVYFNVSFPDCAEPYAALSRNYSPRWGTLSSSQRALVYAGVKTSTVQSAGQDHVSEERTVSVYNCTDDFEFSIDFLGKDPGEPCSTWQRQRNRGFVKNETIGDGIVIEGSYKSYKIEKASRLCGYHSINFDRIIFKKDIYKNNDGDSIKVTFNNDCGSKSLKVTFKVYPERDTVLSVYNNSKFAEKMQVCNGHCEDWWDINFYKQRTIVYNWLNQKVSETDRHWPNSITQYIMQNPYRSHGCLYWQLEVDGVVKVPWSNLGSMGGTGSSSYYDGGLHVALPRWPSGGRSSIVFYPNRTVWPNDYHTVRIKLRNNLTAAGNPESGRGSDTQWTVKFNTMPTITSTQRRPYPWGWWYYCGQMYYGGRRIVRRNCWYGWWRPWNWWRYPWTRYYWPIYRPWYYYRVYSPYRSRARISARRSLHPRMRAY